MGFSNPQQIKGLLGVDTPLTDIFLPITINGDMALLKAIEYLLWQYEQQQPGKVFDQEFINNNTEGYNEFINDLQLQDLEHLSHACGISIAQLTAVAELLKNKTGSLPAGPWDLPNM